MRVLVLGATGPCGVLLIRELLTSTHAAVVVYARNPSKLPSDISTHRNVVIIQGELTDSDSLSKAMEGVHAVLSALGPGTFHPSSTPLANGYKLVLEVMQRHNVSRLIALGTPSIKDEQDKFSLAYATMAATVFSITRNACKDMVAVGETIRASSEGMQWTIVRAPVLTNAEKKRCGSGVYRGRKDGNEVGEDCVCCVCGAGVAEE
ncbi:hypothetical protein EW146_g8517 [Bondarzewia mesenterica]|uniref:NAD(P)-binding domain-containing protein n=1 Tax=Bondarzewia mesenterica TaxID=1095465 RepID=A0A4S4LFM2_9AGAM|nr:hypothetical protein EW146_g8517 [Bondarzewia mesenterica]